MSLLGREKFEMAMSDEHPLQASMNSFCGSLFFQGKSMSPLLIAKDRLQFAVNCYIVINKCRKIFKVYLTILGHYALKGYYNPYDLFFYFEE